MSKKGKGDKKAKRERSRARDRPQDLGGMQNGVNPPQAQRMQAPGKVNALSAGQAGMQSVQLVRPQTYNRASAEMRASDVIYGAVARIANTVGMLPVHLYKDNDVAKDDPREVMLSLRPNRYMSAFAFKQAMEIYRNTEGCAYAVKCFDDLGRLHELLVVDPRRVTPLIEEKTQDLWYAVRRPDGVTEYLHSWYVLALHHVTTDGISGIRVVDVLSDTINYAGEVKSFSLESVKGVSKAIVLEFPEFMGDAQRNNAVSSFLSHYRATGGQILALPNGVKVTALTGNPIDSASFDVEQVTRSRVAIVYSMAPYMLGDYSSGAPGKVEERNIEFLTMAISHNVERWEEELNYKLLTPEERKSGYAFRFDFEAYLRTDSATLASVRQSQIRSGMRTPDELRAKDHLPSVPGGDRAYLSKDLAPMELVAQGRTLSMDEINGEHNAAKEEK